jgi:hypothetical protein
MGGDHSGAQREGNGEHHQQGGKAKARKGGVTAGKGVNGTSAVELQKQEVATAEAADAAAAAALAAARKQEQKLREQLVALGTALGTGGNEDFEELDQEEENDSHTSPGRPTGEPEQQAGSTKVIRRAVASAEAQLSELQGHAAAARQQLEETKAAEAQALRQVKHATHACSGFLP